MTVVVADTSPLNYLILIQAVDVLPRLYGAIVVPRQVLVEMIDPSAPDDVRTWASTLPSWIDVREVVVADEEMRYLDPGERAAILLALSEPDALLLIEGARAYGHGTSTSLSSVFPHERSADANRFGGRAPR